MINEIYIQIFKSFNISLITSEEAQAMNQKLLSSIRSAILITFVIGVIGGLVYSRIMAYSLAPTMKPANFQGLSLLQIPIVYLVDYISHAWICLLFAFTAAGLVYEFIPNRK